MYPYNTASDIGSVEPETPVAVPGRYEIRIEGPGGEPLGSAT